MAGKTTKKPVAKKNVEALTHKEAARRNIPTAEYQSVMEKELQSPIRVAYQRRNETWTHRWCGAARMSRTGQTWW